ncbi:head-tail connector protein [Mycobacterium phage Malec]|uniref:Head-to-tail connector protein n=2 Tax=Turbidovirus TaxID=2948936 RepID=A0A0A0RN28_9CAUD|nr:head-tail connector protein [Mycobacterium phage Larenn]YP_010064111.1 head-tail connector protein [Mycobacterium phage Malec]AIW02915.1 head-to-tail connector protein [Mycobacterium phage Larenn]AZV00814.1 head-to-tail connector complex protein [Mycobacterium phage Malec]
MSASDHFPAPINYPANTPAVTPDKVNAYNCDHDADPPICYCVHDWRIEWANVKRQTARTAVL